MSEDANLKELTKRLATKKNLPKFEPVNLTLYMLIREGERLAYEQEMVNQHNLARDYFRNFGEVIPIYYGNRLFADVYYCRIYTVHSCMIGSATYMKCLI